MKKDKYFPQEDLYKYNEYYNLRMMALYFGIYLDFKYIDTQIGMIKIGLN